MNDTNQKSEYQKAIEEMKEEQDRYFHRSTCIFFLIWVWCMFIVVLGNALFGGTFFEGEMELPKLTINNHQHD